VTWPQLADAQPNDELGGLLRRTPEMFRAARALAQDSSAPAEARLTAASLLARQKESTAIALQSLASWLNPQAPPEIQRAATLALAATGEPEVASLLIHSWRTLSPALRLLVIDTLSARPKWALDLLRAVKTGEIDEHGFDASRRARLWRHSHEQVRSLAVEALGDSGGRNRAEVIESFRPALSLVGEKNRGAAIFTRLCGACHARGGQGETAGPDLRSVIEHSPEKLLVNILDPNADIQPGYQAYNCAVSSGEEFYGVIAAETGNSLVFRLADGSTRRVLRGDIVELEGGRVSLMPEGLENGLEPQDLADLIAFLRSPEGG
jgi:putative heme-binding domain-containing protein